MIVTMEAHEIIQTARLTLRRPTTADVDAIFQRYAGDPVATRYLSWPTHRNLTDTRAFLAWSDGEWKKWPVAGAYLVFSSESGQLLGGTGLLFESPTRAITGYVFAQDAWGRGYATETLQAMVDLARDLGIKQLEAVCHVDHRPSARVLEKCGFQHEDTLRKHTEFPNLAPGKKSDVYYYMRRF